MKIYNAFDNFRIPNCPVVTSGSFDGVHEGHKKIISRLKDIAKDNHGETVLITFWPHPRLVLEHDHKLKLLSTFDEKLKLLEASGIDHLIKVPFTKEFASLSSAEFIQKILIDKIGTQKLVIGYDHRFGKNREGSFEFLKQHAHLYPFDIEEISRHDIDDVGLSSSKIRRLLDSGNVNKAKKYLGRPYEINGTVIHGNKIGRSIGFPTANINIAEDYKLVPLNGVYSVEIIINRDDKVYKGMMNIGNRPTIDNHPSIEVNIFDFEQNIYNKHIQINFIDRIRDEIKFNNIDELKNQLAKDKIVALSSF
ncbi:bifunctional riboflavin kinase/FAD synthetase [Aureibacter tunicatorum]|uniref:Riboflavin biosynthesis protein n=1 Tax=Aureibacter tunicatorum TaxID=866807 RepID=A0AAE3XQ19_9BACT|nr:bifunctional riboflavin kinase/FAD synthetase [Aureibacter tunicatorum]MDR6239851.1 riboflavin kinase/FMN adenylyltransferase [Aureibacter tunicatorum]